MFETDGSIMIFWQALGESKDGGMCINLEYNGLKLHKITRFLRLLSCCIPQSGSLKRAVFMTIFYNSLYREKGLKF